MPAAYEQIHTQTTLPCSAATAGADRIKTNPSAMLSVPLTHVCVQEVHPQPAQNHPKQDMKFKYGFQF